MLIVSDLHLGKSSHFRKSGIPLSLGAGLQDLDKITELITQLDPLKLVFLGDLFHSDYNTEWDMFSIWCNQHSHLELILIEGNHDLLPAELYKSVKMDVVERWVQGNICFTHQPEDDKNLYNVCGHIHPGIRLLGKARQAVKIPCFLIGKKRMILPAFGSLTGLFLMRPEPDETIIGIADQSLIRVD